MTLIAVAACGIYGEIGRNGQLPWDYQPADMQFFKGLTIGHTVVMGRKTAESIGRPLPGRRNLVLTHEHEADLAVGFEVISVEEVLRLDGRVFIIGGGQIYALFMDALDEIFLTVFRLVVKGADTFFPYIAPAAWKIMDNEEKIFGGGSPYWDFNKIHYVRNLDFVPWPESKDPNESSPQSK